MNYQNTSLWLNSLADADDRNDEYRERLRTEFLGFRQRTGVLLEQIRSDFPDLTVHDLSHVDELWRIASLIAGDDYPINPLEAFVLGGAFLLHDAALCFDAYNGGKTGLRDTVAWKDAYQIERDRAQGEDEAEIEFRADFSAARLLHASQSANLVERNWSREPEIELYLVHDVHLRRHLGPLMGNIAASHHQNIEEVTTKFSVTLSAPGEFPSEWQVDGFKLACILRCSDALHIDNNRAPDFLHALRQRSGISRAHWQAQNWLGRPSIDPSCDNGETILVTSTRPFPKSDAPSWWIIYDALAVASRELRTSIEAISARSGILAQPFKAKQIRGCGRLKEMIEVIQTVGWTPCSAAVHVSNVESLVESLGGEKLYGQKRELEVVLRELIQNARDAISSRRRIESGFEGEILITYDTRERLLTIEDDGVGMSLRVLTGPFLSFGTSFWSSDLVRDEFPGLASSGFRASGKFGIGFFSVFMAAEAVTISSRRYDFGYDSVATLSFPKRITLRPVLTSGQIPGFRRSTRISLKIKSSIEYTSTLGCVAYGLVHPASVNEPLWEKAVSMPQYLGSLCASLDVRVNYTEVGQPTTTVHSGIPSDTTRYEVWLRQLTMADACESTAIDEAITGHAQRLRPINIGNSLAGMAAISTMWAGGRAHPGLGRRTAGGFPDNVLTQSESLIVGFIETGPDTAKRTPNKLDRFMPELKAWAEQQFEILKDTSLDEIEQFKAASGLAHFGIDSRELARVLIFVNGTAKYYNFSEIIDLLELTPIAIYKSNFGDVAEQYGSFTDFPGAAVIRFVTHGWNSLKFDGSGKPDRDFSIIDFIQRTADEKGISIEWEIRKGVRRMDVMGMVDAVIVSKAKPAGHATVSKIGVRNLL